MATDFEFSIDTPSGKMPFALKTGSSLIFVGANGGGKTRLAVKIEKDIEKRAHRISAHRALVLNSSVPKISEIEALNGLRVGSPQKQVEVDWRESHRWQGRATTTLLNDFDYIVQALFAEQNNTALSVKSAPCYLLLFPRRNGLHRCKM